MPQEADYLIYGGTVITVDEDRRIIREGAAFSISRVISI